MTRHRSPSTRDEKPAPGKNLLPVLVPMGLGFTAALVFLAFFLSGNNRAELTVKNRSGETIPGVEAGMTSSGTAVELGFLKHNDSAMVEFKRFGAGAYFVTLKFANGAELKDTLGRLAKGLSQRDEIIVATKDGVVGMTLTQTAR